MSEKLESLLKDKRVAIVGPAAYLEGKNFGEHIDKYEVVVRPNYFFVEEAAKKDYGSRTDIMFHNMGSSFMDGLKEQVENNFDSFELLKMIVCPTIKAKHSETDFMNWPDDHVSECATNIKMVNKCNVPFYWVGVANYKKMFNEVGCEPYTGVMSFLTICNSPAKEIYLTGFDFYQGEKIYKSGYLSSFDSSQEKTNKQHQGGHGSHCTYRNLLAVKNRVNSDERIKTDEGIRILLS